MERFKVAISLGSSCRGNNGAGGYAAIISCNGQEKIARGHGRKTTSNRMELEGAIAAIKALKAPCEITFRTDNDYFVKTLNKAKAYIETNRKTFKTIADVKACWKTASGHMTVLTPLWEELVDAGMQGHHKFSVLRVDRKDRDTHRCNNIAKEQIELHILMEGDPVV